MQYIKSYELEGEIIIMEEKKILIGPPSEKMPFSSVIQYGDLVFFSGKIGLDPQSPPEALNDIEIQTENLMNKIKTDLEKIGLSMNNILKTTIFVTDMKEFSKVNSIYKEYFLGTLPARSCVEVSALPHPDALIEMELIAGS
jgi:2-iminobutanoate/2-iminopropanoate deaminase